MKSFLLCLSLAGVLALALVAGGANLDLSDFLALAFAASLMSWFLVSYSRKQPRPKNTAAPVNGSGSSPRRKAA